MRVKIAITCIFIGLTLTTSACNVLPDVVPGTATPEPPTQAPAVASSGSLRYVLLGHRAAETVEGMGTGPREGYQFAIVDIAVENVADVTHDLRFLVPAKATLMDIEGYAREANTPLAWWGDRYMPLPPRARIRMTLVFEVPTAIPYAGLVKIENVKLSLQETAHQLAFPADGEVLGAFRQWPFEFEFPLDRRITVKSFCLIPDYDHFTMNLVLENLDGYDQNLGEGVVYSYIDGEGQFCNMYYALHGAQKVAPRTSTQVSVTPGHGYGGPGCLLKPLGKNILMTVVVISKEGAYRVESFSVDMESLPQCDSQ